jgi:hypothetical protein
MLNMEFYGGEIEEFQENQNKRPLYRRKYENIDVRKEETYQSNILKFSQ